MTDGRWAMGDGRWANEPGTIRQFNDADRDEDLTRRRREPAQFVKEIQ